MDLRLSAPLDYESKREYKLRIRIENNDNMAAETDINIDVIDVNDNMPKFVQISDGRVLENQPPGTPVMQVQARDADVTSNFSQLVYTLNPKSDQKWFAIDRYTGIVTTKKAFDREKQPIMYLAVIASDQVPSSLNEYKSPNEVEAQLRIIIGDVNDNPPVFKNQSYTADSIMENTNINTKVIDVTATDEDSDSVIEFSIIDGNVNGSFFINSATGAIFVNKTLDYELITRYTLTVKAFDGIFNATTQVNILIENVNDNPPRFEQFNGNLTIQEESRVNGGTCF